MINAGRKKRIERWSLALLAAYTLALVVGTHVPNPPGLLIDVHNSDKVLHLTAYAGLALLLGLNWALRRGFSWRASVLIIIAVAVFAGLDEVTQIPVGRQCDIYDWIADMLGASAGMAAIALAWAYFRRPAEQPRDAKDG